MAQLRSHHDAIEKLAMSQDTIFAHGKISSHKFFATRSRYCEHHEYSRIRLVLRTDPENPVMIRIDPIINGFKSDFDSFLHDLLIWISVESVL